MLKLYIYIYINDLKEKNFVMNWKNILLFLKQSIKNIWKSKLGLFIVLLLTFFSSALFTSVISVYENINYQRNYVTNNNSKDISSYYSSKVFGKDLQNNEYIYSPFYDILPTSFYFNNTDAKLNEYNSKSIPELFLSNYSADLSNVVSLKSTIKKDDLSNVKLNPFTEMYKFSNYNNLKNSWNIKWDDKKKDLVLPKFTLNDNFEKNVYNQIIKFFKNPKSFKDNLVKYSLLAILVKNNPEILKNFNFKFYIKQIVLNIKNIIETTVNNLINFLIATEINKFNIHQIKKEELEKFITKQNLPFTLPWGWKPDIFYYSSLSKIGYYYVTGMAEPRSLEQLKSDLNPFKDFIIPLFKDKKYIANNANNVNYNLKTESIAISSSDIFNKGCKGLITPVYKKESEDLQIKILFDQSNSYGIATIESGFSKLINNNDNFNLFKMFNLHKVYAGMVAGYKVNNIINLVAYNNINSKKYNFVSLGNDYTGLENDQLQNLKLFQGIMPIRKNECVISPTFARLNHVKIGDYLNTNFPKIPLIKVMGIGIDPLHFYPLIDSKNPITNPNNEAIIYVNFSIIGKISIKNNKTTSIQTTYLTPNNSFKNENDRIAHNKAMFAFLAGNGINIGNCFLYQYKYVENGYKVSDSYVKDTNIPILIDSQKFDNSQLKNFNFKYLSNAIKIFMIFAFSIFSLGLFLVLISLYIVTKQSVNKDFSKIALLKSLGVKTHSILLSYSSFPLLVLLVIPLGWFSGIFLQYYYLTNFSFFYSLTFTNYSLGLIALLFNFIIIGISAILVNFLTTWKLTRKNLVTSFVTNIEYKETKFSKFLNLKLKNKSFKLKMRSVLFATSIRQIFSITFIIMFSAFTILLSLSIPIILENISNSYFKEINYKNATQYKKPLFNDPMSRITINAWKGQDLIDNSWDLEKKEFYNPLDYLQNGQESSFIPLYSKDKDEEKWDWTLNKIVNNDNKYDDNKPDDDKISSEILNLINNNLNILNGKGFASSWLDFIINWYKKSNEFNAAKESENVMNNVITQIFSSIMWNKVPQKPGQTWKEYITETVGESLPDYIKKYIDSSAVRGETFSYGWNFIKYNSLKDQLNTNFIQRFDIKNKFLSNSYNYDTKPVNIIGLGKDYNSIIMKDYKKDLYNNNLAIKKLTPRNPWNPPSLSDNYWTSADFKIDNSLKSITEPITIPTIPTVISNLASVYNHLKLGDRFLGERFIPELQFLNNKGKYEEIDPSWWRYNDTDYYDYIHKIKSKSEKPYHGNHFLSMNQIDISKLTSQNEYDDSNPKQTGFVGLKKGYDGSIDGQKNFLLRPLYEYKNIELWIPKEDLIKKDGKLPKEWVNPGNINSNPGLNRTYWESPDKNKNFYIFKPYDFSINSKYNPSSPVESLLNELKSWMDCMTISESNKKTTIFKGIYSDNIYRNSKYSTMQGTANKIQYKVIAINKIFDKNAFYIDQKLANLLMGYTNGVFNSYNYKSSILKQGNNPKDWKVDNQPKYNNNNLNILQSKQPPIWFNNKFSNDIEPYDITTQFSMTEDSYSYVSIFKPSSIIDNQELLYPKIKFLFSIVKIGISITMFFVVSVVIFSVILILLVSSLFIERYKNFMILMKAEGYSKIEINNNIFGIFIPSVLVGFILGNLLDIFILQIVKYVLNSFQIIFPYSFSIWPIILCFVVIILIFLSSYLLSNYVIKRSNIPKVLNSD